MPPTQVVVNSLRVRVYFVVPENLHSSESETAVLPARRSAVWINR